MFFKIKKRCGFCAHVLREDGTCANQRCPNYVDESAAKGDSNSNDGGEDNTGSNTRGNADNNANGKRQDISVM